MNNTHEKLAECVTLDGGREHQAAFQAIADANGGIRAAGTPGYDGSLQYVVERMTAAGYDVTLDPFPFTYVALPTLQQLTPVNASYESGAFSGTGYGEVTAAVTEIAEQMAKVNPVNKVRFARWGAGASGLVGSRAYVAGLSQEEQDRIALYLDFDMVGSGSPGGELGARHIGQGHDPIGHASPPRRSRSASTVTTDADRSPLRHTNVSEPRSVSPRTGGRP